MLDCVSSTPSPAAVLGAVREAYELSPSLGCELLQHHLDATYLLFDTMGRYVVRLYDASWWSAEEVLAEMDLLNHLAKAGMPVAAPVARTDGGWVTTVVAPEGERQLVLHHFIDGDTLLPSRDAGQLGEMAGQIHRALEGYRFRATRRELTLDGLLRDSFDVLLSNPKETEEQRRYLEDLKERVIVRAGELGVPSFRHGICHGDLNLSNAVRKRDRRLALFDFELCAPGLLAYDLAVFRWTQKVVGAPEQAWFDFVEGYRRHNQFPEHEYAATDLLAVVRHAYFLGHKTRRVRLGSMGTAWRRPPRLARMDVLRKLDAEAFGTTYVEPAR